MLEEFMNVMMDNDLNTVDEELKNAEVKNIIDGLEMFSNDPRMLTNAYTDILCNDNIVYLLTRISQHPIFMKHFPELYEKNTNGESVINCQQNSPYHRYGVFRHILYTIEYVGKDNLKYSKEDLKILKWTMFLHDIGKPMAKITNSEGKDSFTGHDEISVEIATNILERFYFTEDEKKTILTLIKYHDRYLNEGELTYDNLCFLAQELENKKELFDMIIEVKTADNKAKSIAVYNKFLTVIPKYVDFEDNYFTNIEPNQQNVSIDDGNDLDFIIDDTDELIIKDKEEQLEFIKEELSQEPTDINPPKVNLTKELFEESYQNILYGRGINYHYVPIIDIDNECVFGYEVVAKLGNGAGLSEFLKMAKEEGKYEKINQLLALNLIEQGIKTKNDKKVTIVARIDMKSFDKYNNKTRVYDMTDKDSVLILFENYDYSNVADMNKICKEIKKRNGLIGLANFQKSTFTTKELSSLDIDFIEFKYDKNEKKIQELIEHCEISAQKLWITNIKEKEKIIKFQKSNVKFLSGDCIFGEIEKPKITTLEVEQFIESL